VPDDADLEALRRKDEADGVLLGIPGVRGVGFGGKVSGGQATGQFAYLVYVDEKKAPDRVPAGELIPRQIGGVPTDVLEAARSQKKYVGVLQGGIEIDLFHGDFRTLGTLGCLARSSLVSDVEAPDILLSAYHVLYQQQLPPPAGSTAPIYLGSQLDPVVLLGCCETEIKFANVGAGKDDGLIDAAFAWLQPAKTLLTKVHGDAITGTLDLRGANLLLHDGVDPAIRDLVWAHKYPVWKFGAGTSLTRGVVGDVIYPVDPPPDKPGLFPPRKAQMQILAKDANGNALDPFAYHGDSGSVVLDNNGKVVGLVWGGPGDDHPTEAWACHIGDVTEQLGIRIATNPPVGPWRVPEPVVPRFPDQLQRDLASVPLWTAFPRLYRKHLVEVDHLLRFNRLVGETFRFSGGPAAVNALKDLFSGRLDVLPETLDEDLPWATCVHRVVDAFMVKGSPALRADMEALRPLVAGVGGRTYAEVLDLLSDFDAASVHA